MIAHVAGMVTDTGPTWVVLEIGGLGLHLRCTPATVEKVKIGQNAKLCTSLVVREDALTLYGFAAVDEKDAFNLVQTASGVGPKLAQAIISVLTPAELRQALIKEDIARLCQVPGVGRKGAQRLIIELKDKVINWDVGTALETTIIHHDVWRTQVTEGLVGLGWSVRDATEAVDQIAPMVEANPNIEIGVLMRSALASLAKH